MKISFPYYVVALVAGFVYALAKYFVPTLPFDESQVLWVIVTILTALGVDVTQALRASGHIR
jgi:hypothetical protein